MQRRHLTLAAALLLCSTAHAQTAAVKYGVISLIGESITVSGSRPTTGSRLDQNDKLSITLPDAGFDATALRTLKAGVEQIAPQSEAQLFAIKAPKWVDTPSDLFDGDKVLMSPKLVAAMKADGATQLLLLTRYKSDTQLRFANGVEGRGRVEGLGFYVDREQSVIDSATQESSRGFLGSYVSLRLCLVDLNTSTVLKQQVIKGSNIHKLRRGHASMDPWDALSPTEKLSALGRLIEEGLTSALPTLLSAS